jgi:hypothetical protein
MPKPDNTERNARIVGLANQGKPPADIARKLGIRRGVVLGVLHRARKAGKIAPQTPPRPAALEEALLSWALPARSYHPCPPKSLSQYPFMGRA